MTPPAPLGCLASLFGLRQAPAASEPAPTSRTQTVPDTLPVSAKRYFFSRSEQAFFRALEEAITGSGYRAFPNVRLNDLFTIDDPAQRGAVLGRLRDKHVDFVLVDPAEAFRPVLALELDGASHGRPEQQYRDAVKDVIFKSGGLKLVRLPARAYSAPELRERLAREGLRLRR